MSDDQKSTPILTEAPKQPKKSNFNQILIIVGGIVLILAILSGIGIYNFVFVPNQVVESVNKNIEVNNDLAKKVKIAAENIENSGKSLESSTETPSKYKESIEKVKSQNLELTKIIDDIDSKKSTLDKGSNSDTKDFYKLIDENLDSIKSTTIALKETVDYYTCFGDKIYIQLNNEEELKKILSAVSTNQAQDQVISQIEKAKSVRKLDAESTSQFANCFQGRFSKYQNDEVKKNITDATSYFKQYIDFYDVYIKAIKDNDIDAINSTYEKEVALLNSKPVLYNTQGLGLIFDSPQAEVKLEADKLDAINKKAQNKLEEIKKKYNLQGN